MPLAHLHPAVLPPPPVVRLLGDAELPAHQLHGFAAGQTDLCLPQCSDDLLRSVSLPSYPDLLAEKLQTRSILTLHLVSFQGVRSRNPNAISVAASNWQDELSYYSNWGTGLDLTAPDGELYSNTTDEAGIWSSVRGGYAYFQGTSMAAPQVTGTAAIVASVTGLRGGALRARLEDHADDLGAIRYDTQFGNGRLNSYRSVTLSR